MSFNKSLFSSRFSFPKSRSVVVVNVLLAFLIGFPNTASAADLDIGSNVSLVLPGTRFFPGNSGVFFSGSTLEAINTSDAQAASALTSYGVPLTTQPFVMTTAIKGAMPGGSTSWDHFDFTVGATYKFFALVNPTTNYSQLSPSASDNIGGYDLANLDYMNTWSEAKLNIGGTEHWVVFGWFNLILVRLRLHNPLVFPHFFLRHLAMIFHSQFKLQITIQNSLIPFLQQQVRQQLTPTAWSQLKV